MKVWVFFQYGGTPTQGWGERHYYISKILNNQTDLSYEIFAGNNSHLFKNQKEVKGLYQKSYEDGVKYNWIKVPSFKKSISVKRIFSWFWFTFMTFAIGIFKKKPDIIVVSSIPLFPIYSALIFKYLFKTKVIFEIRDIWPLSVLELSDIKKSHPFVRLLSFTEKIAYNKSDHIVSVLNNADKHIQTVLKEKPFNFTWISNGFYGQNSTELEIIDTPIDFDGYKVLAYAGTIGRANALEYLFEAFSELIKEDQMYKLLIFGDGPLLNTFKDEYESDKIIFFGKLGKAQLQEILKKVDATYIGCRDLKLYNYGVSANKIFEYFNTGKPILYSGSENNLISKHSLGITVAAENMKEIKNGIIEILKIDDKHKEVIKNNSKKVLESNYTYEILSNKYYELFKSILS